MRSLDDYRSLSYFHLVVNWVIQIKSHITLMPLNHTYSQINKQTYFNMHRANVWGLNVSWLK